MPILKQTTQPFFTVKLAVFAYYPMLLLLFLKYILAQKLMSMVLLLDYLV